jgi:hypothetical protein
MEEPTPNIPCPLGPLLFQRLMVNVVEAHGNLYYQGYKSERSFCDGSTRDNLFPSTRKGQLDAELLKTMRLIKERMITGDAFFFHQLLLPICDPKRSGIKDHAWKPF